MNRTMVKRGVGAAALAIVAALLLGWLLKDKDQERQDVVDMKLPGAEEVQQSLNIPSLKGDGSDATKTADAKAAAGAGETVVASADPNGTLAGQASANVNTKEVGVNTFENKGSDIDFTIRPPKGEKREIIDNIGKPKEEQVKPSATQTASVAADTAQQNSGAISRPNEGTVVASTTEPAPKTYRPRLVEEKERKASYGIVVAEKQAAAQSRKQAQQAAARAAAKEQAAEKAAEKANSPAQVAQSPTGRNGYAIQLLATSSSSRANNLKSIMTKEGYKTAVSKTTKNGKTLFRVRVGGYQNRQAAVKAQNSMKRRYQKNQYVKTSMVVAK